MCIRDRGGVGDAEIVLETGLGYFEVQGAGQAGQPGQGGSIRIRFGDSVVTAGGFSVFRINLDNPPGELAVFSGNAHLERGSGLAVDLHGGESLALNGADATKYELNESIEPDSWDTWNSDRDQMLTSEASSKTGATKGFADKMCIRDSVAGCCAEAAAGPNANRIKEAAASTMVRGIHARVRIY